MTTQVSIVQLKEQKSGEAMSQAYHSYVDTTTLVNKYIMPILDNNYCDHGA